MFATRNCGLCAGLFFVAAAGLAAPRSPAVSATTRQIMEREGARGFPVQSLNAQSVGIGFNGATLGGINPTSVFPPDTNGAVGPTQYVVVVNNRLVTFDKTTGAEDGALNATMNTFFDRARNGSSTYSPRIRYDRLSARWFLTVANSETRNRILMAWSDAASAGVISGSTVWSFAYIPADPNCYEDAPTLGVDNNALYIGANTYCFGSFSTTHGWVFPKANLLANTLSGQRFVLAAGSEPGLMAPQGVDNYDPSSTEGYFIGSDTAALGFLSFRRVSDPGGTPTLSANIRVAVAPTSYPTPVPHLGNTRGANGNLTAVDDRLFAAHIRNGRLWTAQNIDVTPSGEASTSGTGRRVGIRWYELNGIRSIDNGGTPVVVQFGTLFDSAADVSTARHFWMPSVMVSGQRHAAIGFSTAGASFYADAGTAGRLAADPPGTLQPFSIFTSSNTPYDPAGDGGGVNGRYWGRYSYTSLDPLDDMTMWTIQQFCDATNSYGVRVIKLVAPPPATPASANPATISAGLPSVAVTISGTSASGSGFFDPGPNLASPALAFTHIGAALTSGISVNSVTWVNPTTVTLDLNTTGATAQAANVTIVNPDGQSATGAGILTITAAGPLVAPANFAATASNGFNVNLTWNYVPGAYGYAIHRSADGAAFALLGGTQSNSYSDQNIVSPNTTYLYQVQAVDSSYNGGPMSAIDLATTTMFTDDPLQAATTSAKGLHVMEARTAVSAVRRAAHLGQYPFVDTSLMGVAIKAVHISDLRTALTEALAALSLPGITYTYSAAAGTTMRAADLNEIRNGTR